MKALPVCHEEHAVTATSSAAARGRRQEVEFDMLGRVIYFEDAIPKPFALSFVFAAMMIRSSLPLLFTSSPTGWSQPLFSGKR